MGLDRIRDRSIHKGFAYPQPPVFGFCEFVPRLVYTFCDSASYTLLLQRENCLTSILQRIANGDESAADDCVRTYGGLVWRLSRRYLDHAKSEIDDAVQDVFIEIWLHAKRFDPAKGSEAAFVATIAHRRLTDRQRRIRSRRNSVHLYAEELKRFENHSPSEPEVNTAETSTTGDYASYRVSLENGFRSLPDEERNALWLSVYRGLSHREISEATEVPIGTVKSRLRRAMIRLTKIISKGAGDTVEKGGPA